MTAQTPTVPFKQLVANENNLRAELTNIEGLARSIEANGIIQPLEVREVDGTYVVIAGHRRLAALAHLKVKPDYPVKVTFVEGNGQVDPIHMLVENMQREDLTPFEQADGMNRLKVEFGMNQTQIAGQLGVDSSLVSKRLALVPLSPAARALYPTRVPDLDVMIDLGKVWSDDISDAVIGQIRSEWDARNLIRARTTLNKAAQVRSKVAEDVQVVLDRNEIEVPDGQYADVDYENSIDTLKALPDDADAFIVDAGGFVPVRFSEDKPEPEGTIGGGKTDAEKARDRKQREATAAFFARWGEVLTKMKKADHLDLLDWAMEHQVEIRWGGDASRVIARMLPLERRERPTYGDQTTKDFALDLAERLVSTNRFRYLSASIVAAVVGHWQLRGDGKFPGHGQVHETFYALGHELCKEHGVEAPKITGK